MKKIFSPAPLFRKETPLFLRLLHALRVATVFFILSTVAVTLLYRFVPPPATPLMLLRLWNQHAAGDPLKLHKDWRPLEEISPWLAQAVIAAEDQRFADHHGFDFTAIEKARRYNERQRARGGRVRGASTISQQTAKNVFLWPARSWTRKGLEVWFTFLIETLWPKRRILEVYLNVAEMGNGIYGAQAAGRHYFGRDADGLTRSQAALLAAILPRPLAWSPHRPPRRVIRRQAWILRQMSCLSGGDCGTRHAPAGDEEPMDAPVAPGLAPAPAPEGGEPPGDGAEDPDPGAEPVGPEGPAPQDAGGADPAPDPGLNLR